MTATELTNPWGVMRAAAVGLSLGLGVAVIAVLPAEYGIDPTGLGKSLGLLKLSGVSLPDAEGDVVAAEATLAKTPTKGASRRTHELVLAPGDGAEFKVLMNEGAQAGFRWTASGVVHFDQHGEPDGDTTGYFESYALGEADGIEGKFTALFTGTHGWYWRNDSAVPITVELLIAGDISEAPGY